MKKAVRYLMESDQEGIRLEMKTDPVAVQKQAQWCGIRPGMRVLDVGCGPGKTTALLHQMVQPEGTVVGLDSSADRIAHARKYYGQCRGLQFVHADIMDIPNDLSDFDFIWVRFVLEYYRHESSRIVAALTARLRTGGLLCLLDLDNNCLGSFELPYPLADYVALVMKRMENHHNFDPYAGRKLYSYIYDQGLQNIEVSLTAHHLLYGAITEEQAFNWMKKMEIVAATLPEELKHYPGAAAGFIGDLNRFILDPRRFIYTPLMMCRGVKP